MKKEYLPIQKTGIYRQSFKQGFWGHLRVKPLQKRYPVTIAREGS